MRSMTSDFGDEVDKRVLTWVLAGAAVAALLLLVTTPSAPIRKLIDSAELTRLQAAGALVVDVRTTSEYAAGHIPDAVNVPLDQLQTAAAGWNKDRAVVVYCATGARSANASSYLAGQGFTKIYDLAKGIVAWTGGLTAGGLQAAGGAASGDGTVKTNGKPVFIDFASST